MSVWLERFLLGACATAFVAVVLANPMKFDLIQRVALGVAIAAFALFVGRTIERQNADARSDSVVQPIPPSSENLEIRARISALIGEAVKIQEKCQAFPDPYKTPAGAAPSLPYEVANWKQRVQDTLSLDLDPNSLQKWQEAILYTSPEDAKNPSVATFCTELGVKLAALRDIATSKTGK